MTSNNKITIRPSSADQIMKCPGSYILSLGLPTPPVSDAMRRGTNIHNIAEMLLKGKDVKDASKSAIKIAKDYVDYVRNIGSDIYIEKKLSFDFGPYLLSGTPDAYLYDQDTMHVVDLKCGNVSVIAKENIQLTLYAYLILKNTSKLTPNIRFHIFQPSCGTSTFDTNIWQIIEKVNIIRDTIDNLIKYKAINFSPSEDNCKYCRAKDICQIRSNWEIRGM